MRERTAANWKARHIAGVTLALLSVAGCGSGTDKAESRSDPGRSAIYAFADGGKIAIPDDFPGDVALYPAGRLLLARRTGHSKTTVVTATGDSPGEVKAFYLKAGERGQWSYAGTSDLTDRSYLNFTKGDRTLTVVVAEGGGDTVVSLVLRRRGVDENFY